MTIQSHSPDSYAHPDLQVADPADGRGIGQSGEVLLRLSDVSFGLYDETSIRLDHCDWDLRSGEIVILKIGRGQDPRDLVSMLIGLEPIDGGDILFAGQTWFDEDYDRHFKMRSQIRRVFAGPAWIQNSTMMENLMIASVHHGSDQNMVRSQIIRWISRLANCEAMPKSMVTRIRRASSKRPAFIEPSVLQVFQWIRICLGQPRLIILERPMKSLSVTMLPVLVELLLELRTPDTGIIWLTSQPDEQAIQFASPIQQCEINAGCVK